MRFTQADIIIFTDQNGKSYSIRDNLPLGIYDTGDSLKVLKDDKLDEIISRPEYYGDGNEDLLYALVDNNAEILVENNFELTNIKELKIPIITTT